MGPAGFPAKGAQARRKTDGILGEIYADDPPHNLLSVRWPTIPGAYDSADYTPEQFARVWELTGVELVPPHPSAVAAGIIGAAVLLFLISVLVHGGGSRYAGYDAARPIAADSTATLSSAQLLDRKYGILAADQCAAGADEYLRSVTEHKYVWDDSGAPTDRFNRFNSVVTTPGVLIMISATAKISNGFGEFYPVQVFCNFDTQSREVLSYASLGLGH
jgi:hypothetical protein